ncbi:hypothetical protein KI387_009235, partial [Taxus chinensis]
GDGLASQGLEKYLHTSSQTKNKVEGGFLDLNIVISQCTAVVVNLDGVRVIYLKGDGLSSKGFYEDLYTTLEPKDQVNGRFVLNIVIHKVRRRGGIIRASQSEYAYPLRYSSSSSFYDVLSVSSNVSEREIKSTYRRMALKYHPDVCLSLDKEECTSKFLQVQQAHDTLSDPSLREDYDSRLQNRMELGENKGGFGNSNNYVWEAQIMELIRRRSSGIKSSFPANEQTATAAASR